MICRFAFGRTTKECGNGHVAHSEHAGISRPLCAAREAPTRSSSYVLVHDEGAVHGMRGGR
jgi:hypothetical protein